jgi:hypothetical protein
MGRYLKSLLQYLDGAPQSTPQRKHNLRRGQSLVELTLVMPILVVMFLGMIEVGWLANNFLLLLDVTRGAARFGATTDPLEWPTGEEHNLQRMDCNDIAPGDPGDTNGDGGGVVGIDNSIYLPVTDRSHLPGEFVDGGDTTLGYYDGVACAVVQNMTPLSFDTTQDDVVVSVFSYHVGEYPAGSPPVVRVTGRFPARQNECSNETYDPFDANRNYSYDPKEDQFRMYDGVEELGPADNNENIRGFVLTGHHEVSDAAGCIGSEFSLQEVEDLLNGASALENQHSPNNGLLIVEIFWHHRQLLNLPWFTTIGNNFELHVWAMYPVTAAEPTATIP